MSTITGRVSTVRGFPALILNHPLVAYFVLAYAGSWIVITPLVLHGQGLISLSDGASFILFALSAVAGPALAAFTVTGVLEGRPGMRRLLRRTFQMRAGLHWYVVALFSFFAIWLVAYSLLFNGAPLFSLIQNWTLLLSVFLPNVLLGLLIPSIGEEPGWRGFALPRLQAQFGPVLGTVILGTLHGIWHLPAFFTPMLGPVTPVGFIAFVLTAIAGTFIYTWIFNNTRGSVWMAMVTHASSNAAAQLLGQLIPRDVVLSGPVQALVQDGWLNVIIFGLAALALLLFTRGRLSYRQDGV